MSAVSKSRNSRRLAAAGKLRQAAALPARGLIESLEDRLHLTVATDANGWINVTPTPGVSKLIYVSSSTGLDGNDGLSPSSPVATIAHAYSLLRNNEPDWLLFKRGDTFSGSFSYFGDSGLDAQDPMVVTSYGDPTLPRPVIDAGNTSAFRTGSYNHDLYVMDISFTSSTHNPTSPNFNGTGSYGFYDTGGTTDLLIQDCQFSYFVNDIDFANVSGPMYRITISRNEILDAYSTDGHSQGMYAEYVTGLTITDNVFDHDGWNAEVPGGGATIYNHDCYLHSSNINCVVTGNIFAEAGSFGLQARAGGIVENNLFIADPYGFAFGLVNGATTTAGGVSGTASGNVVMEPRVDNANGWGIGAMIGNIKPGGNTVISNNIFSGDPTGTQTAVIFQPGVAVSNPQEEVGLNSLTFANNTTYDWGFGLQMSGAFVPGTTGSDGLTGVVIRNNNFQDNVTGRIVNHLDNYDPRYEDWSGNTYSSSTAAQSNWFTVGNVNNVGIVTSLASWIANVEPTASAATVSFIDPNRTIESYMVAQGLGTTEAAFIAGARAQNEQSWNPLYFAASVTSYVQGGYIVVSNAPTAVATPPPDVTQANYLATPDPTFTVTYSDAVGINAATIMGNSVTISGVGSMSLPVTLVGTTASGPSVTATYQISPPNGDWTTVPSGTYVISQVGGQVKDTSGLSVAALPLASFGVTVNPVAPPLAPATAPVGLQAVAGASSINISWSDPAADQGSFILQRALDSGITQGVQTIPLTADQTSYVDSTAVLGTTYYYALTAVNSAGASQPTAAASAVILPPAPALSRVFLNDGNSARVSITAATMVFTQPVSVGPSDVSLIQNPSGAATPISVVVNNPSGDGRTWIASWATSAYNNRLPDGSYALTVHGGLISDAFGQTAGGDQTTNFTSQDGPVIVSTTHNAATPPHTISFTFSQDVSASLSASSLALTGSHQPVSVSWNAATLTATWTFAGAIPDGNYTGTLAAIGLKNADGVHLDGNKDGIPGDNFTYSLSIVKPTLSISGATNVNIGTTYSLKLGAITDAGQSNPTCVVNWGDGTSSPANGNMTVTHVYSAGSGPTTITVDVLDANGTHGNCASLSVSVNRATVALSGNTNANPGALYTLNLGAVTDPGFAVSSYIIHWGDGTAATTVSHNGAVTHPYSNSGGSTISDKITVDLVDNSGGGGSGFTNLAAATLPVTVNTYPFVPTTGVLNANVGGTYTLFIGAINDAGFTVSNLSINWGDGTAAQNLSPGTAQLTHVFAPTAPANDTIRVTLTDNSGTYPNASVFSIAVNPPPTVTLAGNSSAASVGSNYVLNVPPASDPGQGVSLYTVNWGDGSPASSMATPGTFNHTYLSAGNDTITVDITDGTGFFAAAGSLPVTVSNNATIALSGNPSANAGGTYTLNLGAVNDPEQTVTQYTVNWGDNHVQTFGPNVGSTIAHAYATPGSDQITVGLTDTSGITYPSAGTLNVTVSKPTVSLTGNPGVFPGQTYNLTINPANDAGGTPTEYVVNWGDGSNTPYLVDGSAGAISATHAYSSALHAVITTDLIDATGTFLSAGSLSLYVAPPPALTLSGASTAAAGAPYTLTLGQATDAIGTVSSYTVNWGDGSSTTVNTTAAPGSVTHTYSSRGVQAITVDVADQNGTYYDAASTSVTVGNAPSIALSGNSFANANGDYALTLGAVADSNGTPSGYIINWGDGSNSPVEGAGTFTHPYTTPGPANITVDVIDSITTWHAAGSLPIMISPTPTIALGGNSNANATGTYSLTLGPASDPGYTPSQYTVNWGDNSSTPINPASISGPITHTYATPGPATITVSLTDATNTYAGAGKLSITVNSPPTVALGGAASATAGKAYALTIGTPSDPGYSVSQYLVRWGDGTPNTVAAGGVVNHTYASAGSATIQVDLTDPTGAYANAGQKSITIAPANVAPTIALSGNLNANIGGLYTLTLGAVSDPGNTVTKYTVHWGDNSTSTYSSAGAVSHTYSSAINATITVDLTDSTGTYTAAGSLNVAVHARPGIIISGVSAVSTGTPYALTLGAITDIGYAVTQISVNWGDGSISTYSSANVVAAHTYATTGAKTISVSLTDTSNFTYAGVATHGVTVSAPVNLFSSSADIGKPPLAGSATYSKGVYTVKGNGADIYNASDQFHYDYKAASGNTTIIARVASISGSNPWAKAGVMIRNGTAANAAFADVVATPGGYLSFQWRTAAGVMASDTVIGGQTPPRWVKLARSGNTFTAWYSGDGVNWKQVGSAVTISMSTSVDAGLAVTSINKAQLNTATFTNVSVTNP